MHHRFLAAWLLGVPALALPAQSRAPGDPLPRAEVVDVIREVQRIATPEGIDTLMALRVGGNRQWVSIRGMNRSNPVLLFIHGGPASPMMPMAWAFQRPWEDFFTVVQWDQRGAGKSAAGFDTTANAGPWSVDDIVGDAVVVIDSVRALLGKRKVIVVGHSWGSIVGATLAARRPELLHAYVGTGQVRAWSQEAYLYQRVLELSRQQGLDSAVADLERIAPYPRPDNAGALEGAMTVRRWANRFDGGWYGQPSLAITDRMTAFSPTYTPEDMRSSAAFASRQLFGALLTVDLGRLRRFAVPVFVFQGRYDLYTPYAEARRWLSGVQAPLTRLVTFERSAHYPMIEEPGRFLMALLQDVRPLAREGRPFAPGPRTPR